MTRTAKTTATLLALVAAVVALRATTATAISVAAEVDRSQVAVGESTVLSIEASGTQSAEAPQLGDLADFRVVYIGPATQMRFENGRSSSSITHRYQLFPLKPGRFTLGPFDLTVDGAVLRTQPIELQVVPRGRAAAQGAPELRLEARPGRPDPFVGEQVPLTIRLFVPNGVRVDDLQFPAVQAPSLTVGDMPQPVQRDERVNGRPHRVLYFDTTVIPRRAGDETLTVSMQMSVLQQQRGRRGGMFGMFGDVFAERRPIELQSDPIDLSVRGLPVASRPADFNGAVGKFDLAISASPTTVNAGDPVTVRIEVSGEGDLGRVQPPRYRDVEGFRTYDPVAVKDAGAGKRAIEQVVIPQSPEVTELPPLSLSFFDPAREAYRAIHKGPIPLHVSATQGAPSGVIAEGESGRAERAPGPIGRDIVYIKSTPGRWTGAGSSWLGSLAFYLVNLLPAIALAAFWWRSRLERRLAANPRLRKFLAAEDVARSGLAQLSENGDAGVVSDRLSGILKEFLASKLALPPGAVEASVVGRSMRTAGYDESLSGKVESLLGDMEGLRYSARASGDGRELLRRAKEVVDGIERRKDITEKLAKAMAVTLALVASLHAPAPALEARADVASDAANEASFFAGNHAYADGRYGDAAAHYREALSAGEASGPLYFNLGNAQYKQGETAAAVASYLQAQRLLPRDPDVAANLSFAEESLELGDDVDPLWMRLLFPIAYRATEAELALLWTILWWLLCGGLAATIALPSARNGLRWPIRVVAVLAAIVLLNLLFRDRRLELWNDAVVTASKGSPVRFEPSADGTEHFLAPAGARLEIDQEREGWSRVTRRDGRRGWVENDKITRLR